MFSRRHRVPMTRYAAGVLDVMIDREDLIDAEDLAERFSERDNRELVERAAADRDWTRRKPHTTAPAW